MSITKKMLSIFAFAAISLSACSDDKTDANPLDPNGGSNNNNNFEIVASPHTITAKLQTKKYVYDENFNGWKLVPWEGGRGKIVVALSVSRFIAEAAVSADGSFSLTLPGTLATPDVIEFYDIAGGFTANPAHFLTIGSTPLGIFYFYPVDNPATTDINESEYYEMISPVLLNETDLSVIQHFGYIMTESATLIGTSTNGNVKKNNTYKKGWNIETWKDVNGVSEYSVVESLPAKVVWY